MQQVLQIADVRWQGASGQMGLSAQQCFEVRTIARFVGGCAVVTGIADLRRAWLLVVVALWPLGGWAASTPAQSQAPAVNSPAWVAPTESERSLVSDANWPLAPSTAPDTVRVVLPRNEVALLMAADEAASTQVLAAVPRAAPEAQRQWQDLARHSIAPLVLLIGALVLLVIAWHSSRRRRRRSRRRGAY